MYSILYLFVVVQMFLCQYVASPTFLPRFLQTEGSARDRSPSGSVRPAWWGHWSAPNTGDSLQSAEPTCAVSSPGTSAHTINVATRIIFIQTNQVLAAYSAVVIARLYNSSFQGWKPWWQYQHRINLFRKSFRERKLFKLLPKVRAVFAKLIVKTQHIELCVLISVKMT